VEDLIESLANGNVTGVKVVPGNGGGGGDEADCCVIVCPTVSD
jgi:hypothetical protein